MSKTALSGRLNPRPLPSTPLETPSREALLKPLLEKPIWKAQQPAKPPIILAKTWPQCVDASRLLVPPSELGPPLGLSRAVER